MANLSDIRKRVKSIKNTQQITKAMKMVAAAKLRRAQESINALRPYSVKMAEIIINLMERTDSRLHALLDVREPKKIAIIVSTSERGLCGSFNTNILKNTEDFIRINKDKYEEISIIALSNKVNEYFERQNIKILRHYENILKDASDEASLTVSEDIINLFLNKELDEIHVSYTRFRSAISQYTVLERLLPLATEGVKKNEDLVKFILEPSANDVLEDLLHKFIITQMKRSMLDSVASEHGARMTAMDAATSNANEMIRKLTLVYNRARQAAITTELVEIVSGAEALKD